MEYGRTMKRITPVILISLALVAYGFGASNSAQGAPSKAVTQAQITNLQNQIVSLTEELNQTKYKLTDLKNQFGSTKTKLDEVTTTLDGVTYSRHVWLTPAGLSTGCGTGAVYISTYNIPGTSAGLTGCVADILVKPIPQP
jgi:cell division protein FtsB